MRPEKNISNDTMGNRTRDFPVCRAVPHPNAPPRVTGAHVTAYIFFPEYTECAKICIYILRNIIYEGRTESHEQQLFVK